MVKPALEPGVGVTKAPFTNFSIIDISHFQKCLLDLLNHIHIWQVSLQLSCSDPVKYETDILPMNNILFIVENGEFLWADGICWVPPTQAYINIQYSLEHIQSTATYNRLPVYTQLLSNPLVVFKFKMANNWGLSRQSAK